MSQAASSVVQVAEVVVSFDSTVQTLAALEGASYRLIGTATCQIERIDGRFVCRLVSQPTKRPAYDLDPEALKTRFLNLVTDENLRARISEKTEGVRNVVLALAFGALITPESEASPTSVRQ